jgi:hypothetical protein
MIFYPEIDTFWLKTTNMADFYFFSGFRLTFCRNSIKGNISRSLFGFKKI